MGAFQTLREQGLLPLAQVDAHGNLRCVAFCQLGACAGSLASCPGRLQL